MDALLLTFAAPVARLERKRDDRLPGLRGTNDYYDDPLDHGSRDDRYHPFD